MVRKEHKSISQAKHHHQYETTEDTHITKLSTRLLTVAATTVESVTRE